MYLFLAFIDPLLIKTIFHFHINKCYSSIRPGVFCKKGALRNFTKFTGKHLCQSLFFKKETLAPVLSCEFCEISKNTFFYRKPLVAASECYSSAVIISQ